jgi:16S rRNA processing protein RimM
MARFDIPKKDGLLCVGVITQAHSLHGEVLVKTFLDDDSLIEKDLILTTANDTTLTVQKARPSNKGLLVKFEEVKNRNDAEKSRKTYLYLSLEEFPQEEDDEIYYFELKDYEILDEEKNTLGNVLQVLDNGANTILEVKLKTKVQKEDDKFISKVLIPFSKDMVLEIEKDEQYLIVDKELFEMFVNL